MYKSALASAVFTISLACTSFSGADEIVENRSSSELFKCSLLASESGQNEGISYFDRAIEVGKTTIESYHEAETFEEQLEVVNRDTPYLLAAIGMSESDDFVLGMVFQMLLAQTSREIDSALDAELKSTKNNNDKVKIATKLYLENNC